MFILCMKCAKKQQIEENAVIDKPNYIRFNRTYSNGTHGGGKHFKRVVHGISQGNGFRIQRHVEPGEKLNCEQCGKRNEK